MALKRQLLEGFGLNESQIQAIIDNHMETVDALKNRISELEKSNGEVETLKKANADLQKHVDDLTKNGTDAAKVQADFDAFKQQVADEKANSAKEKAVRNLLKTNGVQRDAFLDLLMGKIDLSKVEMDGDNVKDTDAFLQPIKDQYGDCFGTVSNDGVDTNNPPSAGHKGAGGKTREEIMKIEDRGERMKAIQENMGAFGYAAE